MNFLYRSYCEFVVTYVMLVRPSLKSNYPNMGIEQYLDMKNEKGEIFDPWLRLHIKLGAEKLNICPHSYCVKASLDKWEE